MLTDVLEALGATKGLSVRLLVSPDLTALQLGARYGSEPLLERGRLGYRSAARQAAAEAIAGEAAGLLVVPADLPCLTAGDIDGLLEAPEDAAVTISPAGRGGGTNALLTRPPGAIPFLFGRASFRAHLRAAEERSLKATVVRRHGLELDLDQPDDVRRLLESGSRAVSTATRRFLAEIGLPARIGARAS